MNKSNDSKNSTRRRRVLVASILLAGLITIGGTFAWFTSKDEVTNKLTSTSNYGVSIVESFKPPKNWVPGQTVTKQAGVTNTGNVDAFAKVTLSSFIDVTVNYDGALLYGINSELHKTNVYKLVDLKNNLTNNQKGRELVKLTDSEVESIQAGGRLIYGSIKGSSADPDASKNAAGDRSSFKIVSYEDEVVGTGFKPYNYGLYIFERAVKTTDSNGDITYTYSYSGYYFVRDDNAQAGVGTYYAIDIPDGAIVRDSTDYNEVADIYLAGGTYNNKNYDRTTGITLKTTKLLQNNELYFDCDTNNKDSTKTTYPTNTAYIYSDDSGKYYLKARYDGADGIKDTDDDIIIRIYLNDTYPSSSVTSGLGTNWSLNADYMYNNGLKVSQKIYNATFYLNQVLMASTTSDWVITGVEIDPSVDDEAYVSFDYNLTLTADSIQVVYDSDGNIVTFDNSATNDADKNSISASAVNGEWEKDPANVTAITNGNSTYTVTWDLTSSTKK